MMWFSRQIHIKAVPFDLDRNFPLATFFGYIRVCFYYYKQYSLLWVNNLRYNVDGARGKFLSKPYSQHLYGSVELRLSKVIT